MDYNRWNASLIRLFLCFLALGLILSPSAGFAREPKLIEVKQGEAFLVRFEIPDPINPPAVRFRNQTIPLFEISAGTYGALIGIDLGVQPSQYQLSGEGSPALEGYSVRVAEESFGSQTLTLPDDKVQLDEETLARVRKERAEILRSMEPISVEKFWEGNFIKPVAGKSSGRFGERRILNGEPRSPHSGEDIKAPEGTPVLASNTGKVVLVGDFFFTGLSVFIDHGLGCYTMYFHLKEIDLDEGSMVKKGERVGTVGSTGRATGPHLHWGARIGGARVNPLSLLNLKEMKVTKLESGR